MSAIPFARRAATSLVTVPIVFATLALALALSFAAPEFLSKENLLNVLGQMAPLGVIAAAQTLLMVSGSFDLSVGAVYALSGVVLALVWTTNPALAIVLALGAGALVGVINGVTVSVLQVNAFITTFGMLFIVRGITLPMVDGGSVPVEAGSFDWIGSATIAGVPFQVAVVAVVFVLIGYLMSATRFGRHTYAVGGNPEAARLAGVRVRALQIAAFTISALAAAVAGIMHGSEVGAAKVDAGTGLEFSVIAAVVLGGTSLFGGRGNVGRTFVAVLFLAFLQNGFNLMNLAPFYQQAITGAIMLTAVAVDGLVHSRTRVAAA